MHVAGACKKHIWKSDLAHPNSIAFLPVLETSLQINQSPRTQILYTLDDKEFVWVYMRDNKQAGAEPT